MSWHGTENECHGLSSAGLCSRYRVLYVSSVPESASTMGVRLNIRCHQDGSTDADTVSPDGANAATGPGTISAWAGCRTTPSASGYTSPRSCIRLPMKIHRPTSFIPGHHRAPTPQVSSIYQTRLDVALEAHHRLREDTAQFQIRQDDCRRVAASSSSVLFSPNTGSHPGNLFSRPQIPVFIACLHPAVRDVPGRLSILRPKLPAGDGHCAS